MHRYLRGACADTYEVRACALCRYSCIDFADAKNRLGGKSSTRFPSSISGSFLSLHFEHPDVEFRRELFLPMSPIIVNPELYAFWSRSFSAVYGFICRSAVDVANLVVGFYCIFCYISFCYLRRIFNFANFLWSSSEITQDCLLKDCPIPLGFTLFCTVQDIWVEKPSKDLFCFSHCEWTGFGMDFFHIFRRFHKDSPN